MQITLLGSGTSHGIPVIGCGCSVCRSVNPKDKRQRSSLFIQEDGYHLLIDAGPDFRNQALRNQITAIDSVLVTHVHNDHIGGLDDLRPLTVHHAIRVGAKADAFEDIQRRFEYFFVPQKEGGGIPQLDFFEIGTDSFPLGPFEILPIHVNHGNAPILGFRIGSMAYITDMSSISETEKTKLLGLDLLVLGVLRERPHPTHLNLDQALALINELQPLSTVLTHICHEVDHEIWAKKMPSNIQPGWDGLVLEV